MTWTGRSFLRLTTLLTAATLLPGVYAAGASDSACTRRRRTQTRQRISDLHSGGEWSQTRFCEHRTAIRGWFYQLPNHKPQVLDEGCTRSGKQCQRPGPGARCRLQYTAYAVRPESGLERDQQTTQRERDIQYRSVGRLWSQACRDHVRQRLAGHHLFPGRTGRHQCHLEHGWRQRDDEPARVPAALDGRPHAVSGRRRHQGLPESRRDPDLCLEELRLCVTRATSICGRSSATGR